MTACVCYVRSVYLRRLLCHCRRDVTQTSSAEEVIKFLQEDSNYRVAAAPTPPPPPPRCYLSPPQPRPGPPVAPGTPAPADKEGRRETGRTPEGNRCLRYPGFTYRGREAAGEGETRVRQRGFRERKINISLGFFLIVLISKTRGYLLRCLFRWPILTDMMSPGHVRGQRDKKKNNTKKKHLVQIGNMTFVSFDSL